MNIMRKIYNLKQEEIDPFIKSRLQELKNDRNITVGINSSNYIYNGFFDENVRLNTCIHVDRKPGHTTLEFVGICLDDFNMYHYLVKACKEVCNPYIAVCIAVEEYLQLNHQLREELSDKDIEYARDVIYFKYFGKDKCVSIKKLSKSAVSLCTEVSAVTQNMLRFLDIESDYVTGMSDNQPHAYNIIYPRGRKNDAVLFDGSYSAHSEPLFLYLTQENKTKLFTGEEVTLTDKENPRGTKYLFGERLNDFDPFETKYSISYVSYTPEGIEGPTENDIHCGKLTYVNHYKGNIEIK